MHDYEQIYLPREVAYNNIEQYKQKQDRTDRTEKRSRARLLSSITVTLGRHVLQ